MSLLLPDWFVVLVIARGRRRTIKKCWGISVLLVRAHDIDFFRRGAKILAVVSVTRIVCGSSRRLGAAVSPKAVKSSDFCSC